MGCFWPGGVNSRRELIEMLRQPSVRDYPVGDPEMSGGSIELKTVASCYRGNAWSGVLWSVVERWDSVGNAEPVLAYRFIRCDLIRYNRDGWHYKPMRSIEYPYFYSCPERYLAMTEEYISHCNVDWRAAVRERCRARRGVRALKRVLKDTGIMT